MDNNTVFLANANGGLVAFSFENETLTFLDAIDSGGEARSIAIGMDGTIFLASRTIGLFAYSFIDNKFAYVANTEDCNEAMDLH